MRVLHILNELRPSGAETMLRAASGFWRSEGIEGEILITGDIVGDYAPALAQAGYRLHHIPFERSPLYLWRVYRFLKAQRFDSVHIHCERANFWYAFLAFASGRPPTVRSVHSLFPFAGWLRVRRFVQRYLLRRAFQVTTVAVGRTVQQLEQRNYQNPVLHIPNWFDSDRYRPVTDEQRASARRGFAIPREAFVVATVGNCAPVKNHTAVIEALASLPTRHRALYLHAGCEDASRTEAKLAAKLGIDARFLGQVHDVLPVYAAADLFVVPSLYEGMCVAAVEAMGAGVPALLADVDGLRDLRDAAGCEWTAPDAVSIAQAMERCLQQPRAALRERALASSARIHARYAIREGASQYARLYKAKGARA